MITKNLYNVQKSLLLYQDEILSVNQDSTLTLNKTFKDIFNELLSNKEAICSHKSSFNFEDNSIKYISEKTNSLKTDSINPLDDAKMNMKVKSAIKWLANFLGLKPSFLLVIFEGLNINPNDMADETKLGEIINKIAEYFGLNKKQKEEITKNLGQILGF